MPAFECLEARHLLTGWAPPDQAVTVSAAPITVAMGLIDFDGLQDAVTLGADGRLTVARNGGDDFWAEVNIFDLGLGAAKGMAAGSLDADPLLDLAVQTSDAIWILVSDGSGGFAVSQIVATGATPPNLETPPLGQSPPTARVQPAIALLDDDFRADLAVVVPEADEVLVFLGSGDGTLGDPSRYASGAGQPVAVVAANLIGDGFPDLAVGHADGTLTFLEGTGGGGFVLRPDLSISGVGAIAGLAAGDFNGDGEADLAVSAGDRVTVLLNNPDPQPLPVLINGDFSAGLTGWTAEAVGHGSTAVPGRVNVGGGAAHLTENSSFLVSLHQTFTIPESPQTLSVDLLSLGLEVSSSGIPDAFEISLLDGSDNSLVPAFRPGATSFFNAAAGDVVATAPGVSFDGRTVMLDLSGAIPGTTATLYFDLIGHPPGSNSSVVLDNVTVTPVATYVERFTPIALEGPFAAAAGLAVADADGDGRLDVLVADAAADQLLVFAGDGVGGFARTAVDLSGFGHAPVAVAVGALTAGDNVGDAAVVLFGSSRLVSPLALASNPIAPPALGPLQDVALSEGQPFAFRAWFTDDDGLDGHAVLVDWGDGQMDQAVVTVSGSVAFATAEHAYADDGVYTIAVTVVDPEGLSDSGTATAAVANVAPRPWQVADRSVLAGVPFSLSIAFIDPGFGPTETFVATVDWGDGRVSPAEVAITEPGSAGVPTAGLISATHTFAALGSYTVTVTLQDDDGGLATRTIALNAATKFFVVDQSSHAFFEYTPDVELLAQRRLGQQNSSPRGAAADPAGQWLWMVDHSRRVFVYGRDGTLHGQWLAAGANAPMGIATDGQHLWIVGDAKDEVYFYENGAALRSGSHNPTRSFPLHAANGKPSGLETDGQVLWVTDETANAGRIFVYSLTGEVLGHWRLDSRNADPSGLALDPRTGDLWVTDRHDGAVYRYAAAAGIRSGTHAAAAMHPLDRSNRNPEGIADPVTTISIGDVIGSGIVDGQPDEWQFPAADGQRIFVDFQQLAGGSLRTTLTNPAGEVIYTLSASSASGLDQGPITLEDGGVYTLTAQRVSLTQSPTYQFQIWDVPDPDVNTLALGSMVSGAVETPGASDVWILTVAAPLPAYLDFTALTGGTAALALTASDGSIILTDSGSTANSLDNPVTLSQAGGYRLTLGGVGDHRPSYSFRLLDVTPVFEPLVLGTQVIGTTPGPGVKTNYMLDAAAGQSLFLDWHAVSGGTVEMALYSPGGVRLFQGVESIAANNLDRGPVALAETGVYRLEVGGQSVSQLPSYRFTLHQVAPTDRASLVFDTLAAGQIETPGAMDEWTFTVTSPTDVYLDMQSLSGGAADIQLLAPNGAQVFRRTGLALSNFESGTNQLNQVGVYTLRVRGFGDDTSSYSFILWDVPPPDLYDTAIGQPLEGRIDKPGARDLWYFTATAGQSLFLDAQELVGGGLRWELVRPSGSILQSAQDTLLRTLDRGPFTIDQSGEWTLRVLGLGDDAPSHYRLMLFDVTPRPPLPIAVGQLVSGRIDVPGQTREYTFPATAGQTITLDVRYNPGSRVGFRLVAPDGTVLYTNQAADRTAVLAQPGEYRLIVDQHSSQPIDAFGSFSFRLVDGPSASDPLPGADLQVTAVVAPLRVISPQPSFTVSWTVSNLGPAATDTAAWTDLVHLSIDGALHVLIDPVAAEVARTDPLAPGESYTASATVTLPEGFAGDVHLFVRTDAQNNVYEDLAEDNNVRAGFVTVFAEAMAPGPPAIAFDQLDGDEFPADEPVVLSGQATARPGTANIVFIVDVSGSTTSGSGLDANFDGVVNATDDINGDGYVGNILDAEIGALLRVVQHLRDVGASARVSILVFGDSAATIDLAPVPWIQSFAAPDADLDGDGVFDVDAAARSIGVSSPNVGTTTNYMAAVAGAALLLDRALDAETRQVLFLTDGQSTVATNAALVESLAARGIDFHGFQITGSSVSSSLQSLASIIDANPGSRGVARLVSDPNALAAALLAATDLQGVTVDGVPVEALDASGRFFTTVVPAIGPNTYLAAATDAAGRVATQSITLIGVDPGVPLDFQSLPDVTLQADLVWSA